MSGSQPQDLGHDLFAAEAAAEHLEVFLQPEQLLQPVQDDRVVIGQEQADRHVRRQSAAEGG